MTSRSEPQRTVEILEAEILQIRAAEFASLKDRHIFLNTAGGGPMCNSAYQAALEVLSETAAEGDRNFLQYLVGMNSTRAGLATYIGADSPDEIAFTVNSSSSAAISARMLRAAGVSRVFCPRYEFPTSTQSLLALGMEVVFLGDAAPGAQPSDLTDALDRAVAEAGLQKAKSALLASHVNYLSGIRIDLEAAAAACKAHRMICCINATQSFGALPIDVSAGIDMLFGTGLKWAGAGFGTGFLYIRQSLIEKFGVPKLTGWISVEHPGKMDNRTHHPLPTAKSLDMGGGAPPFQNILALGGALNMRATIGNGDLREGIRRIEHRTLACARQLRDRLLALGVELLLPPHRPQESGIVSLEHKDAPKLHRELEQRGIFTTLRRHPEHNTETVVRFGVPFFTTHAEIERATAAAAEILRR